MTTFGRKYYTYDHPEPKSTMGMTTQSRKYYTADHLEPKVLYRRPLPALAIDVTYSKKCYKADHLY